MHIKNTQVNKHKHIYIYIIYLADFFSSDFRFEI